MELLLGIVMHWERSSNQVICGRVHFPRGKLMTHGYKTVGWKDSNDSNDIIWSKNDKLQFKALD